MVDWLIFFLPILLGLFLPPVLGAIEDYLERKGVLPSDEELRLEIMGEIMMRKMREMMREMEVDC